MTANITDPAVLTILDDVRRDLARIDAALVALTRPAVKPDAGDVFGWCPRVVPLPRTYPEIFQQALEKNLGSCRRHVAPLPTRDAGDVFGAPVRRVVPLPITSVPGWDGRARRCGGDLPSDVED